MNILITGGAGYIGSHTSIELLRHGYNIVILDNYCNSDPLVIKRIEQLTGKKVKSYTCDLREKEQVDKVFQTNEVDAVMHFAGLKSVPESVGKPLEYYQNNLLSTLNLLQSMNEYGINKLVFSSSATVYGLTNSVPYVEDMPLSATNPYGWSKVMIEQILTDFVISNKDMKIAILRYFNPIGADPSGLLGEKPEGVPNNLMPYLMQAAVKQRPVVKIYGTDYETKDGTGIRDYLHVSDVAKGHIKALERMDKIQGTTVYNLGRGKGASVLELVGTFEKVSGVKFERIVSPRRPGDTKESYADVKKAEDELDWRAELSLEDMCRDSWNYVRKEFGLNMQQ